MDELVLKGKLIKVGYTLKGKLCIAGEPIPTGGGEPYEGPYIVTPKAFQQQTLATKFKTMQDNVKVLEVPYQEVSNPQGGVTVNIA